MEWKWPGDEQAYLQLDWESQEVEAGFSSRRGGVSEGTFFSLNLGLHVGDDPAAVLINRQRWLETWQADWDDVVIAEQVHGTSVAWVSQEEGGRGMRELESAVPAVDGLLTQSPVGLMAFYADCTPLYFYHPKIRAVGLAHAGWRGTVGKISLQVLAALAERGGEARDVQVAIGPSIGPCCYEVDQRVAELVQTVFPRTPFLRPGRPGHYSLDLWQANFETLVAAGVPRSRITVAEQCTACHPESFFSHRRDGVPTGRMAAWIRLKPGKAEVRVSATCQAC